MADDYDRGFAAGRQWVLDLVETYAAGARNTPHGPTAAHLVTTLHDVLKLKCKHCGHIHARYGDGSPYPGCQHCECMLAIDGDKPSDEVPPVRHGRP